MAIDINWWAILVTVIVSFGLGNIWFGPLFGKYWMRVTMGMTPEECRNAMTPAQKKKMWWSMIAMIIGAFLMNFTLLHNLTFGSAYLDLYGIAAGLQAAFWNWLGFIATVTIGSVFFENRPWKFWFVLAGYYLVVLLINGMILASWM